MKKKWVIAAGIIIAVMAAAIIFMAGKLSEGEDEMVYRSITMRSKEAAAKLAALGYSGIVECGGILDWTGNLQK